MYVNELSYIKRLGSEYVFQDKCLEVFPVRFHQTAVLLPFAFLLFASGINHASDNLPPKTFEGLELVIDDGFSSVYIEPGLNLTQYKRVYLDDAYVAFKKDWQRNQNQSSANRISASDMDKIKAELGLLFREVFSQTLQDNGYQLTTDVAKDVLQIKPAIINLNVVSPVGKAGSNVVTYSESAGEMTLYLELYDSLSGDILARAIDRKQDRQTAYFMWQNRVSNRAAARRILQVWANTLSQGLDKARDVSTPANR